MASTAAITITGQVTGLPQGTEAISITLTNSTSVGGHVYTTLSSAGTSTAASTFLPPPDTKFVVIIPPTTNSQGMKMAVSSSTVVDGIPLSSQGASLLSWGSTAAVLHLWSTGANQVNGVQISYY